MRFNPTSPFIQQLMQAIIQTEQGNLAQAEAILDRMYRQTDDDYEKFLLAYQFAKVTTDIFERVKWLSVSLESAQKIDDEDVKSAYVTLFRDLAEAYKALGNHDYEKKYLELAEVEPKTPTDQGPFYHGTKADLEVGDLLVPGGLSNYQDDLVMNHIYFTANLDGAGLAATLAKGTGKERVYKIVPTGEFENDPNVTDKKFPGNLTRSYRSARPLKIVAEIEGWQALSQQQKQEWQAKVQKNEGEIIN
ncbi:NAD(+)--rifampin ADP-ribosyltransferase [Enterococcus cecorum]|uniref:NAD(+)--rifampin ADP-ribosyltransferase n=1 Tax=Enterococcus cecorum TaxID=44008 RepID=UPI0022D9F067|nr:NAD(+)--rifampin ADP-ribosyltransferase [Enterococcus cecorum]CAI3251872.1 NAD(+)--rifampin ADP-ribosyltransferase [Enterococcus cecorum]CAI3251952.1 NAD(+)--rifampin ADP-ribosyltransferase [Enterococcus cecorum]CAI3251955.1 NAD(+)--rifampin ADP-ribosyltransferase [Enterococcus cecorum]CAI3252507.1 NAD(+)--rifampin ADP-ribosyltransferase [Enterococcus cecorum]